MIASDEFGILLFPQEKVSTGGRKLDPKKLRVPLKKIGDSTLAISHTIWTVMLSVYTKSELDQEGMGSALQGAHV